MCYTKNQTKTVLEKWKTEMYTMVNKSEFKKSQRLNFGLKFFFKQWILLLDQNNFIFAKLHIFCTNKRHTLMKS